VEALRPSDRAEWEFFSSNEAELAGLTSDLTMVNDRSRGAAMAVTATSCQNGRKQPTWLKPQPGAPVPQFHRLRCTNRVPRGNSPEAFEFPLYLPLVSSAIPAPKATIRRRTSAGTGKQVGATQPGTAVKVGIDRGGKAETLTVTLGELPSTPFKTPAPPMNRKRPGGLGLSLAPARTVEGAGNNGAVVTKVDPNGEAAAKGLAAGDVILDVAGKEVNTPAEVRDALKEAGEDGKREVLLRVRSGERTGFVAVPVGSSHQTLWGKIQSWLL